MRLYVKAVTEQQFTSDTLGSERAAFVIGPYLTHTLELLVDRLPDAQAIYVGWGDLRQHLFPPGAIVIHRGDEWRLPQLLPGGAITGFKEYGVVRGRTFLRHGLNSAGVVEVIHDVARDLRSRRGGAYSNERWLAIPIGYSTPIPQRTNPVIAEREFDVCFAGSVNHRNEPRLRDKLLNPKRLARQKLSFHVEQLRRSGSCRVSLKETKSFNDKGDGPAAYASMLQHSKIALAPRGTSRETFRHFEAAMAGCVVISEPLPKQWYYESAPFVYVRDWTKLQQVVNGLLSDEAKLAELSAQTASWWEQIIRPNALADRMLQHHRHVQTLAN